MQPIFYQSPASYRAESMRISRHWWITLPIVVAAALCAFSVIDKQSYGEYLQREGGILETLHCLAPSLPRRSRRESCSSAKSAPIP